MRQKYQVTPLSLPKNIIGEIILVQLLKFRKQGTVWKIRLQPPLEGGLGQPACHNASDRDGSPHTAHQAALCGSTARIRGRQPERALGGSASLWQPTAAEPQLEQYTRPLAWQVSTCFSFWSRG